MVRVLPFVQIQHYSSNYCLHKLHLLDNIVVLAYDPMKQFLYLTIGIECIFGFHVCMFTFSPLEKRGKKFACLPAQRTHQPA